MNLPTPSEAERLYFLVEECGEVIHEAMKVLRFGYEAVNPDKGMTNRELLHRERVDLLAVLNLMVLDIPPVPFDDIERAKQRKLKHSHFQENEAPGELRIEGNPDLYQAFGEFLGGVDLSPSPVTAEWIGEPNYITPGEHPKTRAVRMPPTLAAPYGPDPFDRRAKTGDRWNPNEAPPDGFIVAWYPVEQEHRLVQLTRQGGQE